MYGVEDQEGVREVSKGGDGTKLDQFAQSELGVVEACFDELSMDLFEGFDVSTRGEKGERWMALEVFVRRF